MIRRHFLKNSGAVAGSILASGPLIARDLFAHEKSLKSHELKSDVVIIGGGLGGVAAALAATRNGASVIMTEPTDWIGGQVSQQAVPPDEHQWIETMGRTQSYATFRNLVRKYYKTHYPLTEKAMQAKHLNPGNGLVSRLCHESSVAVAVLNAMLAPAMNSGQLRILYHTKPVEAFTRNDKILAVRCANTMTERDITLHGRMFLDASEEGDLLPLSGTEYVIGAESQQQTGEAHAPGKADPANIQAITWCFAMDHLEGEDHTIEKPEMYDFWRNFIPKLNPPWPGHLLSLTYSHPITLQSRTVNFVPCGKDSEAPRTDPLNFWLYRRIIDRSNFKAGTYSSDITIVNWPQNDFLLGNITDVDGKTREQNLYKAKQLSLSLLYWLQTEAPRPDGKAGWPGLRLRNDITGTDALAKLPYIRESRRIQPEYTIVEQDVARSERKKFVENEGDPVLGKPYHDSVGVGYYRLDLHPGTGGDNYIDLDSVPFQIPLGAMIPVRMDNLIPACKNIGTTHITNGSYRLHPVEWTIGEAAGVLAAHALKKKLPPRAIRNKKKRLKKFQKLLTQNGFELEWHFQGHSGTS